MQLRPTFDEYFFDLFAQYEEENPDVKIEWIDFPYQNYETKLMTAYIGGRAPHVINLPSDYVQDFQKRGFVLPLNQYLSEDTFESYVPTILEDGGRYGENVYALPWYASSSVNFINIGILEEAGLSLEDVPEHFSDLPEFAKSIKEKTGKFASFPIYTENGTLRLLLWAAGVPITNREGTEATFNTEKAVETIKFWTDLYNSGLVPDEALTATHQRPMELYKTGNLLMMETGAQLMRKVESDAPDVYANTRVWPLLSWKGQEKYQTALHTICISSQAAHPQEAADFAAYVTNAQNQLEFCKLTTIIPTVIEALDDPYFSDPEDTLEGRARLMSAKQVRKGAVFRPLKGGKALQTIMDRTTENIALGKISAEEGIAEAERKWNEILQE